MENESKDVTGDLTLTMEQRIAFLLGKKPSDPNFAESTLGYSERCVGIAISKIGEVLTRQYPSASKDINDRLCGIIETHRELPRTSFVVEEGAILLQYPNGEKYPAKRFYEAIYNANPKLGVFEYIAALNPTKNPRLVKERFPWFNNRLLRIAEVGELPLDDVRVTYIAAAYITQVGKVFTYNKAYELLKKAQVFAGVDTQERVSTYLDRVVEVVGRLKTDQRFVATGLDTMDKIAKSDNLDELQTQLLLDLAFIRNKAFDQPAEFKQVLNPLIRLMATGDWEEAFRHRDFLLNHFCKSFPEWRGREHRAAGAITFESFKDLARAVVSHRLDIDEEDVPNEYKK